jgi:hypothetical protein
MSDKSSEHDYITESPGTLKWYQEKDFWYGFIGWFVGNGIGWVLTSASSYRYADTLLILVLLLNIGALIFFAFKKRRIALGMLAAFCLSLSPILCLGLFFIAACFG